MPVDAFGQYMPYLQYLKETILGTNSMFYSLGKSIGGEMYGLFTYYLMSPFNLISLLFKKEQMGVAFYIIMLIKMSISGITFYFFLNRKKEPKFSNLIFSTMYSLSTAVISYGFNIMWLDSLILLPLVCLGIEDLIKYKNPILYTIFLSLTLITNYYMGFIVCIFSGLYFVYKLILEEKQQFKDYLRKFAKFLLFSFIAVLISAIILLPSFIGIKEGRIDIDLSESFEPNFEIQNFISKFFTNSFGIEEIGNYAMPPVFCGILTNFFVIMYFMNSKIKLKEKIASLIMLAIFFASFYIKGLNLFWVMGNEPACYKYRYVFCFTFMYILIAMKSFKNIKEGAKRWNLLLTVLIIEIAGVLTLIINLNITEKLFVKIDMILTIVFYIIFEIYRFDFNKIKLNEKTQKFLKNMIIGFLFLINIVNLTINAEKCMRLLREKTSTNSMEQQMFLISFRDYKHKEVKKYDTSIYRQEAINRNILNGGLIFGYNGINFSASTFSRETNEFLRDLGFAVEHVTIAINAGNTKAMDMLFGIKYILGENNKGYIEEKARRGRNKQKRERIISWI